MKNMRAAAAIMAAIVTVSAIPQGAVLAASKTDLEQQAEDMINQSVMETAKGDTVENTQTDDSEDEDTNANAVDISAEAANTYETIHISTTAQFKELAGNCRYDSWSRDKSVLLDADLDFSREEFVSIESFGGIFDGQGHTISGVTITGDASETGVFGTIQNTGKVSNLKVQGVITPSGTQSKLGGIAGINYGEITGCSYDGKLEADSELGGIVGRNGRMGTVSSCTCTGSITGTSSTGGIVGYNEGTILSCTNESSVNTTYQDTNMTVDQLSGIIEKVLSSGNLNSYENLEVNSDTGGIAGFSSGVIASCTNESEIGYEHVGYNVGGIAGRSSGYMQNNTNQGVIYGRKDVGGVVGQMQPYLSVDFTEDTLSDLETQLDQLDSLVNAGLDNADSYSDNTRNHLTNINGLTKIAEDSVKGMADEGADRYDEAAEKVNKATTTIQSSLSTFSNVADKVDGYLDKVKNSMSSLSDSTSTYLKGLQLSDADKKSMETYIQQFKDGSKKVEDGSKELTELLKEGPSVEDAGKTTQQDLRSDVKDALKEIREGYGEMSDAVDGMIGILSKEEYQNNTAVQDALQQLKDTKSSLNDLNQEISNKESDLNALESDSTQSAFSNGDFSAGDLESLSKELSEQQAELLAAYPDLSREELDPDNYEDEVLTAWFEENYGLSHEDAQSYTEQYKKARQEYENVTKGIEKLNESAATLRSDPTAVKNWLKENEKELRELLENITDGMSSQETSLSGLLEITSKYAQNALNVSGLSDSLKNASSALKDSPEISSELTGALNALASMDLKVNGISDTMRNNGNNLYDSLNQLSTEMQSLSDALGSESDEGIENLRSITSQFNTILNTLQDAAEDLKNASDEDTIEDVSDEDVENTYQGRTTDCVNYGEIHGDTNAGGIAGMIGLEYDLDPETDIHQTGTTSLDYIFRAKCIADHCTNRGKISARNSYAGGIAGHMEMGLAAENANYGTVESEGSYTGGITGYSVGVVRNNTAKCDVSGTKYVGGIVGYGVTVRDNLAMVNATDYKQYVGAIAGRVKNIDKESVSGNYYYSTSIYGIDGVSYEGIAEGVNYDSLTQMDGIPESFHRLVLTFRAEDETVKTITCNYGESIAAEDIPEVPQKDGFHREWSRSDFSNITADEVIEAVYSRVNTLLVSSQMRSAGQPAIEVYGDFRQGDELSVASMQTEGSEKERWMITIPDDGVTTHQIRYLAADTMKNPVIYLVQDGKKTKVTTGTNGQYLTFDAEGTNVIVAVEDGGVFSLLQLAACGAVLAAAALGIVIHRILMKKRRELRSSKRKERERGRSDGYEDDEWLDDDV